MTYKDLQSLHNDLIALYFKHRAIGLSYTQLVTSILSQVYDNDPQAYDLLLQQRECDLGVL